MKQYFKDLHKAIWAHAFDMYPMESCGVIVKDKFIPCKNIALDPYRTFNIDGKLMVYAYNNNLQAVVHSHVDYPFLSKEDMIRSSHSSVPWGVAFIDGGKKNGIYFWGDSLDKQDFKERPFVYGIYDCYTLVRDYYLLEMKIKLPPVFSDYGWWEKGESLFEDLIEQFGFQKVKDVYRKGDIFMWAIDCKTVNHIGVYTGDCVLQHLNGRLSGCYDANIWGRLAKYIVRKERC